MPPKTVMLDQESVTAIAQALRHILTQDDTVKEKLTDIVEEVVHDKLQEHFTPNGGYDVSGHLVDSMAAGMGLDGPEGPAKELAALVGDALEPHLKTVTNAMNQMRTELAPGAPAGGPSGGKQKTDSASHIVTYLHMHIKLHSCCCFATLLACWLFMLLLNIRIPQLAAAAAT